MPVCKRTAVHDVADWRLGTSTRLARITQGSLRVRASGDVVLVAKVGTDAVPRLFKLSTEGWFDALVTPVAVLAKAAIEDMFDRATDVCWAVVEGRPCVVVCTRNGVVHCWALFDSRPRITVCFKVNRPISVSAGGGLIAVADSARCVKVFGCDGSEWKEVRSFADKAWPTVVCMSPDGATVAVAHQAEKCVRLYDPRSGADLGDILSCDALVRLCQGLVPATFQFVDMCFTDKGYIVVVHVVHRVLQVLCPGVGGAVEAIRWAENSAVVAAGTLDRIITGKDFWDGCNPLTELQCGITNTTKRFTSMSAARVAWLAAVARAMQRRRYVLPPCVSMMQCVGV